ncbi:MAG: SIS domain-containing protein [Firmicutes bacterium]|nr:SIS domain-containing protein [Bacillota bacterium]
MITQYFKLVQRLLDDVLLSEKDEIAESAAIVAKAVIDGGVIHVFGCGHSHMFCEELFYRAGGLVPVKPVFNTGLMLHEGPRKSSSLERFQGYGAIVAQDHDFRSEDVMIVVSNSGRNPVPIEVACAAKEQGLKVIVLTSLQFSKSQPSRHDSGKHLCDFGDVVIDNKTVPGDASLRSEGITEAFGPVSTVVGATILNAVIADSIRIMQEQGHEPPIFVSGNLEGADDRNQALMEQYGHRINF